MRTLTITVDGFILSHTIPYWERIESMIGVMLGDTNGRLTRIARLDGACDYRDSGIYELTYQTATEETLVTLTLR